MPKEVCLCIHGHFYQPPRENPWIEEIEPQESAAPYHDWNERIYYECYLPNAKARVLDSKGYVVNIVNNYEQISFNFGPTLLSWMEKAHPETYAQILEADRLSVPLHHGHGNAIAQVYNHMIMPLASRRDKVTQVKWGIQDFRHRFGREPESIWLPETACNEETLEVLIEEGIKFIILSPHQVQAVSPMPHDQTTRAPHGHWKDVSHGAIDPKMAYRIFLKNHPDKFIDAFFYDGLVSKDLGFGDLAFDAKLFADRLDAAKGGAAQSMLIHLATDGETFGHHKGFGERALAYLMYAEAPKRGYRFVNYGEFLEANPPHYAARLIEGENGEGTSWSCMHGVRRWKENCGCRGGGPLEWNQHWRKPLRESLDWLRDEMVKIFEEKGSRYFKDVWAVRNDYISIILSRSPENQIAFFEKHAKHELTHEEVVTCYRLLEMQRYAQLMYTSCGWFFTEISGIETAQILQYAARAIQFANYVMFDSLEEGFLQRLGEAKSNLRLFKDGRGVYEKLVKTHMALPHHIVAHYGIGSIFEGYYPDSEELKLYCFEIQVLHQRKESSGNMVLNFGRVRVTSTITSNTRDLIFIVVQIGLYDFRCSIKPFLDPQSMEEIEKDLFDGLDQHHIVELLRKIDSYFGETYYSVKDLLLVDRLKILSLLTRGMIEKISGVYEKLYDENQKMNEIYRSVNLPFRS
ncbi:MAG: DUF3536 domain-containing protein [Candidatus Omnitrophica bacterium]|nr:DUF3536 domain-containing protein [Candidatus Omnitrophota bacterium]